ncbi:MAG: WD40 repeat domain-containing protein, partial [Planctomycetales bacterium]|nr:WD40 repeat domain-containing protein [Planctomycetales bacterium]
VSGKLLPTPDLNTSRVVEIAMSPEGKQFAMCGFRGDLTLRDADNGEVLIDLLRPADSSTSAVNEGNALADSTRLPINAVAFAPSGNRIAASSSDGFWLYDINEGREILRHKTPGETLAVQFSPDGRILATGHDHQPIQLWDAVSGELIDSIPVTWRRTLDLEFHPDGAILVASGESLGEASGEVRAWQLRE